MLSTRDAETLRLQWMAARYKERVGERIKAAREALDWSQAQLAREMPGTLDSASISRWETGRVEPRADNLQALADALGVDPAYFLMPEPEPGTGDLMGALNGDGDPVIERLVRIEEKLDEVLSRLPADALWTAFEQEADQRDDQPPQSGEEPKRKPRKRKGS